MEFYRRRLPHWHPPNADLFVTWRLHGSLPAALKTQYGSPGEAFVAMDNQLDSMTTGPFWLKNPEVAECVSQVLLSGMTQWHFYRLLAWVVMSNHVHVLVHPIMPVPKAIMNVKSASARAANVILNRTGKHFWQDESYDHWVRNDRERNSIIRYIHNNPVAAGLVDEPQDWPWSSASRQRMALP